MKCLKLFKRICKYGHDTEVTGRYKNGNGCKACGQERCKERRKAIKRGKRIVSKKKYCVHGHNTFKVGRNKEGACRECLRIIKRRYYKNNKKEMKRYHKKRYRTHKKQFRLQGIEYRKTHKSQLQKRRKKYQRTHRKQITKRLKHKRHTNILFRLQVNLRSRLTRAIKNNQKTGSAISDLGCTIPFFKKYIEKKFNSRMTWKNWGKYWQLDHKVAFFKFDLTDRKQLLKAVNYKNMQPLTKPDHIRKCAKETYERNLDKIR